jgi:signal transduction histidine kinase
MKFLKNLSFIFFSISSLFWSFSFYFCLNPVFLSIDQWAKINFIISFLFFGSILFLIFSLSEVSLKTKKRFFIGWAIFSILSLFIFYFKMKGVPPSLILISSFFLIFLFWLFSFFTGYYLKIFENLRVLYSLILVGIFLIWNGFFYFFFPKDLLKKEHLLMGPLSSLFLIFFEGLTISIPFLEARIFLNEILMLIIFGTLFFLFFSISEVHLQILISVIFFSFLIFSLYFMKILFEEAKRRKEMEKILKEERELTEAKDQFILAIQHHLRTPLGPVRGYLERILDGTYGKEENPVIKEKLVEIKKLVDGLYSLVETLLDIQELKLKKEKLNLEECQIENLIESVVEELLPSAQEKGIYLKYEKTKLPTIKVDKKRIREAIWNLVDNAIKYTRSGGVKISTKIEDGKLKIEVADTGIGMEKEEIERFLEGKIFERGREAKKMYGPGRGIGLALAVEFVKAHGGRILAKSEGFGKGSTFWIELPVK